MLQYLRIKNLALLEEVQLEFKPGFTTVTGETGAGKSVLLGALALLSGARVEKSTIRQGAGFCGIEAVLDLRRSVVDIDETLNELGLAPTDEKGILILKRTIYSDRPQRIYVNGGLATLAALQKLGKRWIDFHGPGEPQKLLLEKYQLKMLDVFSGLESEVSDYQSGYDHWKALLKSVENMKESEQLSEDEQYFYKGQIDEIDSINPTQERIERLERDFKRLHSAKELAEESQKILMNLVGSSSVIERLRKIIKSAEILAELDPAAGDVLLDRLKAMVIECDDIGSEYDKIVQGLDFDDDDARAIQNDMSRWLGLQRKYGSSLELVLQKRTGLFNKLQNQTNIDAQIEALLEQADVMEKKLVEQASMITQKRRKAGQKLAQEIQKCMLTLGFKHALFEIKVEDAAKLAE